jgi:hypothetical protein
VHRNELHDGKNYDLVLVTEFDDAEGLAEYDAHPAHAAVAVVTRANSAARAAIDFSV